MDDTSMGNHSAVYQATVLLKNFAVALSVIEDKEKLWLESRSLVDQLGSNYIDLVSSPFLLYLHINPKLAFFVED